MKISKTISHGAQYTALVDILFATLGVFVIVFALQDLDPPQELQPAPYDHLVLCETPDSLIYVKQGAEQEVALNIKDVKSGRLAEFLGQGGRVLVGLTANCLAQSGQQTVLSQLRDLEEQLSDRPATQTLPLTLFEFSPLDDDNHSPQIIRRHFFAGEQEE